MGIRAVVIGYNVSSVPAVKYGKFHYHTMENDKTLALKQVKVDFFTHVFLGCFFHTVMMVAKTLTQDIRFCSGPCGRLYHHLRCLPHWLVTGNVSTGEHWQPVKTKHDINHLELQTAFLP